MAGDPDWNALVKWGASSGNAEIAAAAMDATPEDRTNLFSRVWRWQGMRGGAAVAAATTPNLFSSFCPRCGAKPVCATLRPESDGSRRSLVCSQCAWEWPYQRILCPSCGEQRFDELPVYQPEEFPHLRVECCASCKTYLVAVDLSKEPQAIAVVDDIAALPLHVWANDGGYTKSELNLFGF